jgi:multidrug efflux system outer membrane protein
MSQVRAEYESVAAQVPPLKQAIAVQEHALSVLVGRNPGPIARTSQAALHAPVVPAGLPSDLLNRRPDILQAEQQLIASNAQIGARARAVLSADQPDRPVRLCQRFAWQSLHRSGA